jgi:hypothetical protein
MAMTRSPTNPADLLISTMQKLLADPDVALFLTQGVDIPAPTATTQTIPEQKLLRAEATIRKWKTKLATAQANADCMGAGQFTDWLFAAGIVLGNLGLHELAGEALVGAMERAP